jgi:hypothetical protein
VEVGVTGIVEVGVCVGVGRIGVELAVGVGVGGIGLEVGVGVGVGVKGRVDVGLGVGGGPSAVKPITISKIARFSPR